MNPLLKTIIDDHWAFFVTNCTAHAPIDLALLDEFPDEFDWRLLSSNPELNWSLELFERYRDRWDLRSLQGNPGVVLDEGWIQAFGKARDWERLSRNPSIANDALIARYQSKLVWHWLEQPGVLSEAQWQTWSAHLPESGAPRVIESEPKTLSDVFYSVPEALGDGERPLGSLTAEEARTFEEELRWMWLESYYPRFDASWAELLIKHGETTSKRFYREILQPMVGDGFSELFRERMASQKAYFYLAPANEDDYGLIPAFAIDSTLESDEPIVGEFDDLKEGPNRTPDFPKVEWDDEARLAFSTHLLPLLEAHHLSPHTNIAMTMEKDPTKTSYTLMRFDAPPLFGAPLELETSYDLFPYTRVDAEGSDDYVDILYVASQRLIDALKRAKVVGLTYKSAAELRIQGPEQPPVAEYEVVPRPKVDPRDAAYIYFQEKMERMQALDRRLPASYLPTDDDWGRAEERLQVIFPTAFKESYVPGECLGEVFNTLPVEHFYVLEGYEANHPETFGAIAIADEDGGDALFLMLNKASNYKLGKTIYETEHDSGQVKKFR